MTKYELLHGAFTHGAEPAKVVATFEAVGHHDQDQIAIALEIIFAITQNIDRSWLDVIKTNRDFATRTPAQHVLEQGGCRSTSVDDLIYVTLPDGSVQRYACADMGFERI